MGEVSTIDLDIAKSVFQVHGVDADGVLLIRGRGSHVLPTHATLRKLVGFN
jgi:transposase